MKFFIMQNLKSGLKIKLFGRGGIIYCNSTNLASADYLFCCWTNLSEGVQCNPQYNQDPGDLNTRAHQNNIKHNAVEVPCSFDIYL